MSKKAGIFGRGNTARAERLAETARIHQQETSRTGKGVIQRGNESRKQSGIDPRERESEIFPAKRRNIP